MSGKRGSGCGPRPDAARMKARSSCWRASGPRAPTTVTTLDANQESRSTLVESPGQPRRHHARRAGSVQADPQEVRDWRMTDGTARTMAYDSVLHTRAAIALPHAPSDMMSDRVT